MNSQTRREIRLGLIALAMSALLFALGLVLRGPVDLADPGSCCRLAAPPTLVPGWTIIVVGGVLHLYGLFGLYRYLTYQAGNLLALPALVLTVMGATRDDPIRLRYLAFDRGEGVLDTGLERTVAIACPGSQWIWEKQDHLLRRVAHISDV